MGTRMHADTEDMAIELIIEHTRLLEDLLRRAGREEEAEKLHDLIVRLVRTLPEEAA